MPTSSRSERERVLKEASYNPFLVPAKHVTYDLLTDSGTGSMSCFQWAAVMKGDESYAGARSFLTFEKTAKDITGFHNFLPIHQARAAERILFHVVVKEGSLVLGNGFLDTAKVHLERCGAVPVNISVNTSKSGDFNGDIQISLLERYIARGKPEVSLMYLSVTSHTNGGQPVSMACVQAISQICRKNQIPFYLDASRLPTNTWFVRSRERAFAKRQPLQIAREMFALCDGCLMSTKKDGICNTGAFLATNSQQHHALFSQHLILTEGFVTYGGMTGRDMEAAAVGLQEALDENYLRYRIESIAHFGEMLKKRSVPIIEPIGGYAVCIDAGTLLSHLDSSVSPAWALNCALYLEGGIRGSEEGHIMKNTTSDDKDSHGSKQLLRLALPGRAYTYTHLQHISDVIASVVAHRTRVSGMRLMESSSPLRHFTAVLEPINREIFPAVTSGKDLAPHQNGYRRH